MRSMWNRWTRLKNCWQSRQSIERAAATWLSRLTVPNTPEQHHGATNQSGPKWWHYNNTYIWVYLIADCAQIECCQSNLHRQNHKLKWNQYEIHIFISIDNRDLADFKRYCISWLQGCPYIQCMHVRIYIRLCICIQRHCNYQNILINRRGSRNPFWIIINMILIISSIDSCHISTYTLT